jgi:oxalate decarboxylase/phosphoglucose isomerase-like protein (cupin superfamily)
MWGLEGAQVLVNHSKIVSVCKVYHKAMQCYVMDIEKIGLMVDSAKDCGFEIQGLQKSKVFEGNSIDDIIIQSINVGQKRGGHYHKQKTEWFLPLSGKATLLWSDNLTAKRSQLKTLTMEANLKEPYVYKIPSLVAHWTENNCSQPFVMAIFNTKEYDQKNTDTYKVQLLGE